MLSLSDASIRRRTSDLVLSWVVDGDLTAAYESWLLSFDVSAEEPGPDHQFQVRFEDGSWLIGFVDRTTEMHYSTPQITPQRVAQTWTVVCPAGDSVARTGTWRAVLSFDAQADNASESRVEGTF